MKSIICILIILNYFYIISEQSSCVDLTKKVKCSTNVGDHCGLTRKGISYCSPGLFCDPANTCQLQSPKGGYCTFDKQCQGIYTCHKGVCSEEIYGQLGQSCEQDYQCGSGLDCANGVCSNPSDTCSSDIHCPFGQYCNGTVCSNRVNAGDICHPQLQKCQQHQVCQLQHDGITHKCVVPFSVGLGGACSESSPDLSVCDHTKGLLCNTTSRVCEQVQDISFLTPTSTSHNCNVTSGKGCKDGELCYCDSNGEGLCISQGEITTNDCGYDSTAFYNCMNQYRCNELVEFTQSSCAIQHCGSQYCKKQRSCGALTNTIYKSIIPSCRGGVAMVHTICDMIA